MTTTRKLTSADLTTTGCIHSREPRRGVFFRACGPSLGWSINAFITAHGGCMVRVNKWTGGKIGHVTIPANDGSRHSIARVARDARGILNAATGGDPGLT